MPIPAGRLGQPEDIAGMAMAMLTNPFLASKVITVDGGSTRPDWAFARPQRPAGVP